MSGRRHSVVRDELGIKGGGVYCYFPFMRLDKYHRGVFKIGRAINFTDREDGYHTYFPQGMYGVAYLENPPVPRGLTKGVYYEQVGKFICNRIAGMENAHPILSTTRSTNATIKGGKTEWIYCSFANIKNAFKEAERLYGGNLQTFDLRDANRNAERLEQSMNGKYKGSIVYTL